MTEKQVRYKQVSKDDGSCFLSLTHSLKATNRLRYERIFSMVYGRMVSRVYMAAASVDSLT